MVSSWSGNNTNYWLVAIASLIVQNLSKVMNIMWTFPPHLICKIHHNFRKLVLYLLVNMNQFHYRRFNITFAPFNYLINGTIFRAVSFQKVFFTYIPILSLELRTSFHEKQWTLLYLISKHYLLHLLDYWVRIMWILFWFHHQTARPQGEFTCIMLWHKGLLIVWCVILKQSIQRLYMKCNFMPYEMW